MNPSVLALICRILSSYYVKQYAYEAPRLIIAMYALGTYCALTLVGRKHDWVHDFHFNVHPDHFSSLETENMLTAIPGTTEHITPATDTEWLVQWGQHTHALPQSVHVPLKARSITTPLLLDTWRHLLVAHPHRDFVHFFLQGISSGFRVGFSPHLSVPKSSKRNLISAQSHEKIIDDYLAEEMLAGRVAGPFTRDTVPHAQINRFGVIPKSHQPNKWRLVVDLSHPRDTSVNDGIPKHAHLCSMSYISVDDAMQRVVTLGCGTLLAKIDIKSAFRLTCIPVHPADRHLLAMEWKGAIYVDTCLPFGLRSAPKLFNIMADLLEWILLHQGVSSVFHYLDDYLTMGPPDTQVCHQNLRMLIEVCAMLGIPLALNKVEGPSSTLEFLGILLDTVRMEARPPPEKLARIQTSIQEWLTRSATKREILSLVALSQHAAKVVRPGRTFVSRMYSVAASVKELDYFTRLNKEFQSDVYWWHMFIKEWNGISFLPPMG